MIVPNEVLRAARVIVGLSHKRLARHADLSTPTVNRLMQGERVSIATLRAARRVLTEAGVLFLPDDGVSGPGLRLPTVSIHGMADLLRGARSALSLSQSELSKLSHVAARSISRMESGKAVTGRTVQSVIDALAGCGVVVFSADGAGGPGFRIALSCLSRDDLRY